MTEDQDFLDELELTEDMETEEGKSQPSPNQVSVGALEIGDIDQVEETKPIDPPAAEQPKPEPQHVPITALLDERDKRKGLEQELERLRAQQTAPSVEAPDMFEDPDGFAAYQDQKVQAALYGQKLQFSERMAKKEYGADVFEQAKAWAFERCNSDPMFNAKVAQSPDPYDFAISEWKREQIVSQVTPDDFAQFQAWKAAQTQLEAQTKPSPVAPPRSLASAPSAGGISTEAIPSEMEIFEDTIRK